MASKTATKLRLRSVDDLFDFGTAGVQTPAKNAIVPVKIEELKPFPNHPFSLYEGERLEDMVESIRANGVLVPIIVRKVNKSLQILAGHNRVNAAREADLAEIPAIVLEDISDEEALAYVVETNIVQRGFKDMSHSERATVLALHHSKMFSQGKRTDIAKFQESLEKPCDTNSNLTSGHTDQKLTTREEVGKEYDLSGKTVARYLRINQLVPELKEKVDNNELSFLPAVSLSFLKEKEQKVLNDCMNQNWAPITIKRADAIRELSKADNFTITDVQNILSGATVQKKSSRVPKIKISKNVYEKYFSSNQSAKDIQKIVEEALAMYFAAPEPDPNDVDALFNALEGDLICEGEVS